MAHNESLNGDLGLFYKKWTILIFLALAVSVACIIKILGAQWKGSNRKQIARWQHVSRLKASAFCIW